VVQNKTFFGHRVILQYRCPALLSPQNSVTINDVEPPVFQEFLAYLYTDHVDCDKALLPKLATCAEKFKVTRLKKLCLDMTTTINVDVPDSTFQSDMKQAINNQETGDVTFIVQGTPFFCHKAILSQVNVHQGNNTFSMDTSVLSSHIL
jgi:hypothetical protein